MTSSPPGSKYFGTETAPSAPVFSDYAAPRWCGVQSPVPCEEQESCCDRDTRDLGSRVSRRPRRRVDGRATPEPNRAEIRAAAQSTCNDTGGPRSIDQPLNSASFHSVEGMHNVALVEHGEQALDSAHRVVLARCDIFRQDATCILHRAQYRFLIGRVQTELLAQQNRELKRRPADSFQSTASRLTRARAGSEVVVQCGCRAVSKTLALAIHPGHYLAASGFVGGAAPFLPNSR